MQFAISLQRIVWFSLWSLSLISKCENEDGMEIADKQNGKKAVYDDAQVSIKWSLNMFVCSSGRHMLS